MTNSISNERLEALEKWPFSEDTELLLLAKSIASELLQAMEKIAELEDWKAKIKAVRDFDLDGWLDWDEEVKEKESRIAELEKQLAQSVQLVSELDYKIEHMPAPPKE